MFNAAKILGWKFFNFLFPVNTTPELVSMTAAIVKTNDRFALVQRGGGVLKTYSRRRDAVRGAERLGLVLA